MRTNFFRPLHRHRLARRVRNHVDVPPTSRPPRIPNFTSTWIPSTHSQQEEHDAADDQPTVRQVLDKAALDAKRIARKGVKNQVSDYPVARGVAAIRLDRCAKLAKDQGVSPELRAQSWRAYAFAKRYAPDLLQKLLRQSWDALWSSQSIFLRQNRHARAHVMELYRDMLSVGLTPTTDQKVAYLESLFLNRGEDLALQEWEDWHAQSSLPEQAVHEAKLLEIGAWMHSLAGNPDRARDIMDALFEAHPDWDPNIIKVVIRAYTRSSKSKHHDAAMELHFEMRVRLGDKMTKIDYDNAFTGFLEAGHIHHSTKVLGDMVKAGYLATDYSDEAIDEALRKLYMLSRLATDMSQATEIALFAITTFPRPYHFRVYGEWLKQAVVHKAPEAAAQILDTMYKRGCEPETIHFNLLLKALFRTKERDHTLKAENIGWHMADRSFKGFREGIRLGSAAIAIRDHRAREVEDSQRAPLDSSFLQKLPSANAATIALLMKHHADLSQWEHVSYLRRQMENSDILPNSDVMNVIMNSQCRQGHYHEVWKTYRFLTTSARYDAQGVFPTGATFRCLWKTLRLALGDHATRENNTLPSPRRLLAETVEWWKMVRGRYDADRYRVGLAAEDLGALNGLVMHCFSYTADLVGSLVALHAMRDHFNIYPSPKAAEILQKQIVWVDMRRESNSVRFQYSNSRRHQSKFSQMARIYTLLGEARLERMNMTDEQYAYLSQQELGELKLNRLSEFVRVILKRQHSPETVEAMIEEAKEEIGLPDLSTGDMDAFAVA